MKMLRYILASSLLVASACSSEFLNEPPVAQQLPEDYFSSSPKAATEVVNAVYNKMLDWNQHTFSWMGVSSIVSDDADKGSDPGDTGADKDRLDAFTFTSDGLSFNEVWSANYQGVARANQALAFIPRLQVEDRLKKRLEGEARFLRAYFYWNLVRCFGGVPLVTGVPDPTNPDDITAGRTRATRDQVIAFIIEDLTFGTTNLTRKSELSPEDIGRATQGAAKTFLAKVYLYEKNWAKVVELTSDVINSGEYNLVNDYSTIWREVGENSVESIFEVQGRGETPNRGLQGYAESQGVRGQFGWGFNTPTQDLADAYEPGDERRDATIIFAGETLWDGVQINATPPNPRYNQKAYVSRVAETFNGNAWESNKNLRIFRFAEVLLMNAEALNELGQSSNALTPLNRVRDRAGLDDLNITNKDQLRLAIYKERRLELAFEHDRFFDLVRQGRAGQVLRAHGKPFVDGKHELFPIPLRQIELSGGLLTQNPGY